MASRRLDVWKVQSEPTIIRMLYSRMFIVDTDFYTFRERN